MLRTSLRQVTLTSFTLGTLLQAASCQGETPAPAPAPAPANDPRLLGLPTFLLPVPGGNVEIGITAEELVNIASQAVSPMRPANAVRSADKFETAMKRTASTMGQRKVHVDTFLLAKWPVKCAEYETFVAHKRAAKAKVRPPFGWWRYGQKADYESKLEAIGRAFPKEKDGPVLFWERNGHELPYALTDDRGQSIADFPVGYVSYTEANEFAGWLGMRLPTEAEWTRAARGDGTHVWPWGLSQPDLFTEPSLRWLGLDGSAGQKPTKIGAIQNAAGPYGHLDMFGRIWQMVSGLGYSPINGQEPFQEQWKVLQKDKAGAMLKAPPAWKDDKVLAKGGSYLSWQEPVQLFIDARAPMQSADVLEAAGFRLAKSLKPGFDMLFSLVRGQYNRSAFAEGQVLDEAGQVGAERYEIGANGFPTAYHAVSFMPVLWLTNDTKVNELGKLLEKTHVTPMVLGTLALTEAIKNPDIAAGLYTVCYRKEGMPKELADAIKQGHKELLAAQKQKGKGGEAEDPNAAKPEPEAGKDKPEKEKKGNWRDLCTKYGITDADLVTKEAAHGLNFLRIDGTTVPTDDDCFLLLSAVEGKVVATVKATNHRPAPGNAFANDLNLGKGEKQGSLAKFKFGIPIKAQDKKRVAEFHLNLELDCAPPSAELIWRLPAAAAAAPAAPAVAPANGGTKTNAK